MQWGARYIGFYKLSLRPWSRIKSLYLSSESAPELWLSHLCYPDFSSYNYLLVRAIFACFYVICVRKVLGKGKIWPERHLPVAYIGTVVIFRTLCGNCCFRIKKVCATALTFLSISLSPGRIHVRICNDFVYVNICNMYICLYSRCKFMCTYTRICIHKCMRICMCMRMCLHNPCMTHTVT